MKKVLLFSCVLIMSLQAQAGNYVVGVEALEYYPLYEGKGSSYKGYARELLDEFAKAKGHSFSYKAVPVKRLFGEYLAGNVDFKYPDNAKWASDLKKNHKVKYSDSTVEYIDGVMTPPGNTSINVSDFKTIGTLRGFTPWVYMDGISSGKMMLSESDNMKSLIAMAESGRIQGAYFNVVVSKYYMENNLKKPNVLVFNKDLPHSRDHFSLSSIKYPKVIGEFNDFLKEHHALVEKLKDKYQVRLP
ncbi:MAG: transporter substrate-binding domain-containing protein [Bermanella sp.]